MVKGIRKEVWEKYLCENTIQEKPEIMEELKEGWLDENENIILVDGDDYTDNFWTDFCYIFEDGLLDDEGNIVHITEQDDIIE